MKSPSEQILPIAELLPEGLSEAAITEIATLVDTVISEQVEEKVTLLETKKKKKKIEKKRHKVSANFSQKSGGILILVCAMLNIVERMIGKNQLRLLWPWN